MHHVDPHRVHRHRARRRQAGAAPGGIAHFGSLCRVVERLQADAGFDDTLAEAARDQQSHFQRMVALAGRLDLRADGAGHAMRRSLCLSLQQQTHRADAVQSLLASVADRPVDERIDLYRLMEHLLITGFGDHLPMPLAQCRRIHQMLSAAVGALG